MEQREGYKKTEIGWIPEDWELSIIGESGFNVSDGNYSAQYPTQKDFVKTGIPFIRANNIKFGRVVWKDMRFITELKHSELKKGHLLQNDILISTRGEIGKIAIVQDEFIDCNINAQLVRLNTNGFVNHYFLAYFLSSDLCQKQFMGFQTGSALKQLPVKNLKSVLFLSPPLPEQNKIASILTTVDDKISSIDSQIQQTEQLKKGLMEKILTEGIGHTEFKDTEIGRIPVEWGVITVEKIVKKIVGGGTPSRECFDYYKGDIPWITVKDLATKSYYKNSAIEHISEEGLLNSSANLINRENIIIATRMGLGRGFINTIDMAINQDMKALYLDREKISKRFFLFWYLSKSSFIESLGTGTTVKGISLPTLKKLVLPFPPLPEQKQIATILSTVDDKLDILTQKKSHYQTLKKGLSQQLLTGQMRVKV